MKELSRRQSAAPVQWEEEPGAPWATYNVLAGSPRRAEIGRASKDRFTLYAWMGAPLLLAGLLTLAKIYIG